MDNLGYITGDRIKLLRAEKGYSQDKLCDLIEEQTGKRPLRKTIANWEHSTTAPDLKQLTALSNIFGVDIAYLLGDCDTFRADNKCAVDSLGLSEDAVHYLKLLKMSGDTHILDMISKLIVAESEGLHGELSEMKGPRSIDLNDLTNIEASSLIERNIDIDMQYSYRIFNALYNLCVRSYSRNFDCGDSIVTADDIFTGKFMDLYAVLKEFVNIQRQDNGLRVFN